MPTGREMLGDVVQRIDTLQDRLEDGEKARAELAATVQELSVALHALVADLQKRLPG